MRASNSEQFLTRVAADPPVQEDFGLANGLNDLSNVVSFTISINTDLHKQLHRITIIQYFVIVAMFKTVI